jgi:arsenite methyltransferase
MPETAPVSYANDNAALAREYDISSDFQYEHGKRLVEKLELRTGERVLDVGAGTGRLALHLADLIGPAGEVVAVDPLAERVALARSRARTNVKVVQARAEDLTAFPEGSFDAVVLNSVFHWIADQEIALEQIKRVLKQGGRLALNSADPDTQHEYIVLLKDALGRHGVADPVGLVPPHRINVNRLGQLLEQAGFEKILVSPVSVQDRFNDIEHLLRWNASSYFGNFLPTLELNEILQKHIREVLADRCDESGIKLRRNLVFAWASKPTRAAIVSEEREHN